MPETLAFLLQKKEQWSCRSCNSNRAPCFNCIIWKLQQKHEISSNLLKEEWGAILCLVGGNPAFYDFYFQACLKITTDLVVNQRQYKMISILRVKANRSWGMNIKVPGQWLSFPSILSSNLKTSAIFNLTIQILQAIPQIWNLQIQIKANLKHKELSNHERKCQYFSKIKTVQNTLYIYSYFIAFSSNFLSGLW